MISSTSCFRTFLAAWNFKIASDRFGLAIACASRLHRVSSVVVRGASYDEPSGGRHFKFGTDDKCWRTSSVVRAAREPRVTHVDFASSCRSRYPFTDEKT